MKTFSEAMEQALQASKYNYINGTFEDLGEKLMNFVEKVLKFLFDFLNIEFKGFGTSINPSVFSRIFVVIAIIAIVAIVTFVLFFIIRRKRKKAISDEIFDDYRSNKLTYGEIAAIIDKYDAEGNYSQAVRYRYIALIMLFNAEEIVMVSDSMTGGQFVRAASKAAPRFSKGVNGTVNMYYSLFFGNKAVDLQHYKSYVDLYNNMVKEASSDEK